MSQGDADNRHADDTANLASDTDSKVSEERSENRPDDSISSAADPATSTANGAVHDDTGTALSIDHEQERSPGPHPEEMVNGGEEEGGYIRINGNSHEVGGIEEEVGSGMSSSQDSNDGDQDLSSDGFDPDLRRVKVYQLVGSRWLDRGTAFCSGDFDEQAEEAKLIARSESTSEEILSCTIRAVDVYQRQQDTLIVWTEPDGTDYALSFQDVEGCAEVWDFIVEVQRHLSATRAVPGTAAYIIQSGHLPAPKPEPIYISEIEKAIRAMARSPKTRETMCTYIQEHKYIHQLVETFKIAERDEEIDVLHALCSCMQTILLLNEHQMYEHILADDLWLGVVGVLEYDPEFPKYKANYREFLLQRSHFRQPIVIEDAGIQRKIHQTYRLQYLKDVILGRALDDSTFNVLNSCIIFNQIDIINHVQQNERFLSDLVSLFIYPPNSDGKGKGKDKDDDQSMDVDKHDEKPTAVNGVNHVNVAGPSSSPSSPQQHAESSDDVERKKEVVLLLQQLCTMGKNVQLPARVNLFRTLAERGVLYVVQWAMCRPEKYLISTAGEILAVLLDHHTLSVRNHVLSQAVALGQPTGQQEGLAPTAEIIMKQSVFIVNGAPPPFKETLAQVLVRMLANSHDLALQNQLADALRMLLDVPQTDSPNELQASGVVPKLLSRPVKDELSTERFLDNFYKTCVETLFRPLTLDIPDHHDLKNNPFVPSRERGNLYLYLCDLLCSFCVQHSFRSYFFVLSSNIVAHIASLLSVRDKHLCLAALRFFRICLKLNNRNLFTHIHKHECYTPITNLTLREARRDNLLSSTCQEFFEYMRKENFKEAIQHVMESHEADFRELAKTALGTSTFQGFVSRWEINKQPPPPTPEKPQAPKNTSIRMYGMRDSEEDESYFFGADDEDDPVVPVPRADTVVGVGFARRKRHRAGSAQPQRGMRPMQVPSQRPQSPLSSLLDYDEDDDITSPRTEAPNPLLAGRFPGGPEPSLPTTSPILQHRQIQILPYEPPEREPPDPEDDLLEALVSKGETKLDVSATASRATPPVKVTSETATTKPREKRRRAEDEEDDVLERFVTKTRRLSKVLSEEAEVKANSAPPKVAEEGSRKLKLRLNVSKALVQPASDKLHSDAKDDNG